MTRVIILNLADFVQPSEIIGLMALAQKIDFDLTKHLPSLQTLFATEDIKNKIEAFHRGKIKDADFSETLILAIARATGTILSTKDFNAAWALRMVRVGDFKNTLSKANHPTCKLVFVSDTNPKDMDNLRMQLDLGSIPYTLDRGSKIDSINGIQVRASCVERKTLQELISATVDEYVPPVAAASSTPSFFSLNRFDPISREEVKYVRCITTSAIAPATCGIETIGWDLSENLSDIIAPTPSMSMSV